MDYCLCGCLDLVLAQIIATKVLMIIKAYKLPSLFKFKINYCCKNRLIFFSNNDANYMDSSMTH
jgi:hypothetical protein